MKFVLAQCHKAIPSRSMMSRCLAATALFAVAACSDIPDAINPSAWVDAANADEAEQSTSTEANNDLQAGRGTPPPGSDESFPTLGRVDRQVAGAGGLSADTQGRQYAEGIQRQGVSGGTQLTASAVQPPAAPNVEAQAPTPQPATPVVTASPTPQPTTPVPQTPTTQAAAVPDTTAPAQIASAPDAAYGVDEGMRGRLAQQLAEIRARAADQGSLLPPDLTSGGIGQPTIIVSSGGIETATAPTLSLGLPSGTGGGAVSNQGALPLPAGSTKIATILFNNGSSQLDARDRQILADVARLQKQSNGVLRVIGHASQRTRNMDATRHQQTNLNMSASRAQRVATALKSLGVAQNNVLVAAVGDSQPVYLEVMPSGEAGNRRAEIYLTN